VITTGTIDAISTPDNLEISANTMHRHMVRRWAVPPSAGRCWIVWHITRTLAYWRAEARQAPEGWVVA